MNAIVQRIFIYPLSLRLREPIRERTAPVAFVEPIIVVIEFPHGVVGYGELHVDRQAGEETHDTVFAAWHGIFSRTLLEFRADTFPEALERIEALPWHDSVGRPIPRARSAVELAMLDAAMRFFRRNMDDVVRWMGLPGFGLTDRVRRIAQVGMLDRQGDVAISREVRRLWWRGFRTFKLPVGIEGDRERLAHLATYLKRPLTLGRTFVIVDVQGRWTKDQAIEWLSDTAHIPLAGIEQPLARGSEDQLPVLRDLFDMPLIHDESLVTQDDARRLIDSGIHGGFNIKINKCGGLMPSLRIASMAKRADVDIHFGSGVGETGILTAAGVRFLQACPSIRSSEMSCNAGLLSWAVATKPLRIRPRGRPPRLSDEGLGVEVDVERLRRACTAEPTTINL